MHSFRYRGFTLIELLVVIAILAILFVIFFPVFYRPHHGSRQTACLNNQRQIGVAINMYVMDNNEVFFPDTLSTAWAVKLKPYNEASIYDCPTKTGKGSNGKPEYGFNPLLFSRKLAAVANPAVMLLTADLNMTNPSPNYTLRDVDRDIDPRHNQGAVVSCVDGHVSYEHMKNTTNIAATLLQQGYDFAPTAKAKDAGPYVTQSVPAGGYAGMVFASPNKSSGTSSSNMQIKWDADFHGNQEVFPGAGLYCSFFDSGSLPLSGSGSMTLPNGIVVGYLAKDKLGLWVGGSPVASANTLTPILSGNTISHTLLISGNHITWSVRKDTTGCGVVEYQATPTQMQAAISNGRKMAIYLNSTSGGSTATMKNIEITNF
ncbi:MAG: type II secretion system protein [Armatimonadota bacterium]